MAYSRTPLICKIHDLLRVLKMILVHQLLYAIRPRDDDLRKNDRDRELFSELIEPPIHPNLIQVVPPFLEESNPVYRIQMIGEAAWIWKEFYWLPRGVFDSLQASVLPLGYMLKSNDPPAIGLVANSAKI